MMTEAARYRGSLLGLAAGDALGTTLEFRARDSYPPLEDMVGGGPFGLEAGQWTDDTSMALCLAESLVVTGGFDPVDQLKRYSLWAREGHLSCRGDCFDIGGTVRAALAAFRRGGQREPYCGSTEPGAAGNGSIMRLAPVPLAFARLPARAVERAAESSRTTHGALEAVDACRYLAALIVGAVGGAGKGELLRERFEPVAGLWAAAPLAPRIDAVAAGSFKRRGRGEVRGTGYVVESLEAALWAFHRGDSFREGALLAANLGDDADTTGAVYGQLAGAYYGEEGIPASWRAKLARRETIVDFADRLLDLAAGLGRG